MDNPWLGIPLSDYEGHMALPEVGQAVLLGDIFEKMLTHHQPRSVALLGCSGGNGLERISTDITTRVVAIDVNPGYVAQLSARFRHRIPNLEVFVGDVETIELQFAPVEFIFAGLLFEYVDVETVLKRIPTILTANGVLGTVVQIESPTISAVTPSPFRSLQKLSTTMRLVSPDITKQCSERSGLTEISRRVEQACGGKQFAVQEFRRF